MILNDEQLAWLREYPRRADPQDYIDTIADLKRQLAEAQEQVDRAVLDSAGDYLAIEKLVRAGIDEWATKPHNRKWFKKIDGTPILNDLMVNITQRLAANRAKVEKQPQK